MGAGGADSSHSFLGRTEQPPVRYRPHARRRRLHFAAARDDETEPPRRPRETSDREGGEDLGERSRIGAMSGTRGLDCDRQETVAGVDEGTDLAAGVGPEEVKRRQFRLPRRPAEQLVEDGGLDVAPVQPLAWSTSWRASAKSGPVERRLDEPFGDGEAVMDEARETVSVEYPADVRLTLREGREEFARELEMLAAVKLYELGKVSSGKAAALAGLERTEFSPGPPR